MVIVISLVLLGNVANTASSSTTKLSVVNDSISIAPAANVGTGAGQINNTIQLNVTHKQATTDWRATECPLTSITLTNSTGTAYTVDTDYVFTAAYGNFTLKNTSTVNASIASDNLTYVSYTHCDTGYLTNSGDRALSNLYATVGIIALLIIVAGVGYKFMND